MIYVAADLHGYDFDTFRRLLSSVKFCDNDWLYILGDVVDRGPDGLRYLEWLLTQGNAELLRGNHEDMLIACSFVFDLVEDAVRKLDPASMKKLTTWIANGGQVTINDFKTLTEKDPEQVDYILEYLTEECPLYETVSTDAGDFLLTHAGLGNFSPDKKIKDYSKKELLWNRPSALDEYYGNIKTVFGHTPTVMYSPDYRGRILRTRTWIDIDVGCAMGNPPALLRLDDLKEFYA